MEAAIAVSVALLGVEFASEGRGGDARAAGAVGGGGGFGRSTGWASRARSPRPGCPRECGDSARGLQRRRRARQLRSWAQWGCTAGARGARGDGAAGAGVRDRRGGRVLDAPERGGGGGERRPSGPTLVRLQLEVHNPNDTEPSMVKRPTASRQRMARDPAAHRHGARFRPGAFRRAAKRPGDRPPPAVPPLNAACATADRRRARGPRRPLTASGPTASATSCSTSTCRPSPPGSPTPTPADALRAAARRSSRRRARCALARRFRRAGTRRGGGCPAEHAVEHAAHRVARDVPRLRHHQRLADAARRPVACRTDGRRSPEHRPRCSDVGLAPRRRATSAGWCRAAGEPSRRGVHVARHVPTWRALKGDDAAEVVGRAAGQVGARARRGARRDVGAERVGRDEPPRRALLTSSTSSRSAKVNAPLVCAREERPRRAAATGRKARKAARRRKGHVDRGRCRPKGAKAVPIGLAGSEARTRRSRR